MVRYKGPLGIFRWPNGALVLPTVQLRDDNPFRICHDDRGGPGL